MGLSSNELKATEPVYATLTRVAQRVPGWTHPEQMLALYCAVAFNRSVTGDVVEIGAWCGRSTIALGLAAKAVGCRVHTVDIFPERDDWQQNADGTWSVRMHIDGREVVACANHTVWDEAFQSDVLPVYANGSCPRAWLDRSLEEFGLDSTVTIYRGTAHDFVLHKADRVRARLLFLDGDHSEEAVSADLELLLPLLEPGAILCLDDAFTGYDGVDGAIANVVEAATELFDHEWVRITRKMLMVRRRAAPAPEIQASSG